MRLEDDLLEDLDGYARRIGDTRAAVIRALLRRAVDEVSDQQATSHPAPPEVAPEPPIEAARPSVPTPGDEAAARCTASKALDEILCRWGRGSVKELAQGLGVSRQTVRNWRTNSVEFSTLDMWRVATFYAAQPRPTCGDDLDALAAGPPVLGAGELYALLYSDDSRAASLWLLANRDPRG